MDRNLRKVNYTLEGENSISPFAIPDNDVRGHEELKEKQKKREGLFHCFGNKIKMINEQPYIETYGIVEDVETGEVKSVFPTRIKFVLNNED